MIGTKEATQTYNTKRHTHAWYAKAKYEELKGTRVLPRLTIDEQKVLGATEDGPGVTEAELGKYSEMTPRESQVAIISLLEQELIEPGPVEEWML